MFTLSIIKTTLYVLLLPKTTSSEPCSLYQSSKLLYLFSYFPSFPPFLMMITNDLLHTKTICQSSKLQLFVIHQNYKLHAFSFPNNFPIFDDDKLCICLSTLYTFPLLASLKINNQRTRITFNECNIIFNSQPLGQHFQVHFC